MVALKKIQWRALLSCLHHCCHCSTISFAPCSRRLVAKTGMWVWLRNGQQRTSEFQSASWRYKHQASCLELSPWFLLWILAQLRGENLEIVTDKWQAHPFMYRIWAAKLENKIISIFRSKPSPELFCLFFRLLSDRRRDEMKHVWGMHWWCWTNNDIYQLSFRIYIFFFITAVICFVL